MRVWQATNLIDDTVITFRNLRYVLKALRRHEVNTGHYQWTLRSFVAPAPITPCIGVSSPYNTPEFLYAEVAR